MIIRVAEPSLVMLCGAAASGKSTFARRHFPDTAVVSSDRCRAMIADDEADMRVSRQAFALFHQIIAARLGHRRLTVADSTALQPDARRALRQIARRAAVPLTAVMFDVSSQTALQWNGQRSRRVGRPIIDRQWALFQQALRAVPNEGYDQVVVLGAADLDAVRVEIMHATGRHATPETQ